jgi:hypothetical protein
MHHRASGQSPVMAGEDCRAGAADGPAMTLIHEILGLHIHTMFLVVTVSGPASSQNILSTAWCCKDRSERRDELGPSRAVGDGDELTLSNETSVTSPSGPASDGSSTSVLAPEIYTTVEQERDSGGFSMGTCLEAAR